MNRLIDLITNSKSLYYIDAETQESFAAKDFKRNDYLFKQVRQIAFLYLDNSLLSIKVLLTFIDTGHVIFLLNPKIGTDFKRNLENLYLPDFIFDIDRQNEHDFERIQFDHNFFLFERKEKIAKALHPNLKLLLTTSGTTGSPKFVKLSESNIISNAESIANYLPIESQDVVPLNLPIFYSYGLSVLTSNSIVGGKIICTNKDILNKEFWKDFETYGFTTLAGVPYIYEVLNRIGFLKKSYPSLRYMTQAGGKLSTKLIEIFNTYLKENGQLLYIMYGQTEATARMSFLPPTRLNDKLGSIGIPIPGGAFCIDEQTNELIYSGANIFGGYAVCIEDLALYNQSKTLRTGDIAKKDEDGFYYIIGRLKRFVKIHGTRINLDEVENILGHEFSGTSFYVIGYKDELLYIFTAESSVVELDVKKFLKEKMQIHPSTVKVTYMENIPLTSNGKINYSKLEEYA